METEVKEWSEQMREWVSSVSYTHLDVYKRQIAKAGKCVLYVTSENSEILAITDRTYVMYGGRIMAELETKNTSEDEIMYYSTGGK